MSTDLDTNIRSFLARIEDATPMAPPMSALRMTDPISHHGRAISLTVSAAVIAAGIAGIAAYQLHDAAAPASTGVTSTSVASAVSSSAAPPTTTALTDDPAGDVAMSVFFYSLLDIPTPAEVQTFLTTGNTPEAEVADCMHSAGYEYTEETSEAVQIAGDVRTTMSAADFAATYGFGFAAESLGTMPHPPLAEQAPNLAHVQSLSKDEQSTWFQAQHWCRGGYDTDRLHEGDAWTSSIADFREVLRADPQVVDALAAWQSCMTAAGHPFSDPQAMREELTQRVLQTGLTNAELQPIFADEVAVAVANVPCEAPYSATYRAVATERFGDFRTLFDAAMAAP